MTIKLEISSETGLQFFGKLSASISHEIKNVLAIINENAGLLDDFTMMADRGMPVDPARLKKLAQAVMKQIRRADGIVKNMNRLAHSIDETVRIIDLNETIELLIVLTARFAAARGVRVASQSSEESLKINTSPFFLMNLLWLCLDFALDTSGDANLIEIAAEKTENGARIHFRRLADLTEALLQTFPTERVQSLLDLLDADLTAKVGCREIVIELSGIIDNQTGTLNPEPLNLGYS